MGEVAVSNRVVARSGMGRFIAACEQAATETVKEAIQRGARISRAIAPSGSKVDPRTTKLRRSIKSEMLSATSGHWYADARHAIPQEMGGAAHPQTGWVSFFWDREGRMWNPGDNLINHPGNPPSPYLKPAYDRVMAQVMEIARQKYPG